MSDWTKEMGAEWDDFVNAVRTDAVKKIDSSAFIMTLVPNADQLDIKFAVELGLALMMDKPIMLLAMPGRKIPARLARVADRIVYADLDLEEGAAEVVKAVREMMGDKGHHDQMDR